MKAFLILLLLASGGCVTRVETVEAPHFEAQPETKRKNEAQTVTDKRVVIDPALDHVIHIVRITSTTGAGGYLKIQLNLQNLTESPKKFTYQIEWFDRDGLSLAMAEAAPLSWMLLRGETSFLAATSPTPAAKDFRVTFLGPGK